MVSESHKVTLDVCVKKDLQEGTGQRKNQLEWDCIWQKDCANALESDCRSHQRKVSAQKYPYSFVSKKTPFKMV